MLEGCCQSASKIQHEQAFFPADRRSGGFSGADSGRRLVAGLIGPVEIELVEVVASAIELVKVNGGGAAVDQSSPKPRKYEIL